MRPFATLFVFSILMIACKSKLSDDTLPRPIEEKPVNSVEFGRISLVEMREMRALKDDILEMAHSVKCTNPEDWKVVGLGRKPCGGYVDFLAYYPNEEEHILLEKIEEYNQKSEALFDKYQTITDCMIKETPKVTCVNGQVVLK